MYSLGNSRFVKLALGAFSIGIYFWGGSSSHTVAQESLDEPYIISSNESGELSSAITDAMRSEIHDQRLFVIVRLGKGETNRKINRIRLSKTKSFMLLKGFDKATSVFAEGERVEDEGRIEFYIGSRLRLVILAKRNEMPYLTCCPDYIPPAKKRVKKSGESYRQNTRSLSYIPARKFLHKLNKMLNALAWKSVVD